MPSSALRGLNDNWELVEALAGDLQAHGKMMGVEVETVLRAVGVKAREDAGD